MEIGQRVRIKPEELEGFFPDTQRKLNRGRIGVIIEMDGKTPVVIFSKDGRRKEFYMGRAQERYFEAVEGE